MKKIYLLLSVVGAIVPYLFFFQFIQAEGLNIPAFISALFVNGAAGGLTADLLLASFIFWLFMFQQVKESNSPKPYSFIVLNLIIGLACALPLKMKTGQGQPTLTAQMPSWSGIHWGTTTSTSTRINPAGGDIAGSQPGRGSQLLKENLKWKIRNFRSRPGGGNRPTDLVDQATG